MFEAPFVRLLAEPFARFSGIDGYALPRTGLLAWFGPDGADTIGLSISDYEHLPDEQQSFFFIDPSTPKTWASFAALWADIVVETWFCNGNVMGTEAKGVAVYRDDTDLAILRRAYRYFPLPWSYSDDTYYIIDGADIWVDGDDKLSDTETS